MRHQLVCLAALLWLSSATAWADTCGERHESCVESCAIDHGMDEGRKALNRCLATCDRQRADCRDLRGTARRQPREAAQEERAYGTRRPDTQPFQEQGSVETAESTSWAPSDFGEEGRAQRAEEAWFSEPEDRPARQKDERSDDRSDTTTERERAAANDDRHGETSKSWTSTEGEQGEWSPARAKSAGPDDPLEEPRKQPAGEPDPAEDSGWNDFGNE
ncbi:MAG: hypothetical protein ACOX6T_27030 [Myxococcales bacterium]|jgi:hypothetical protein